MIKAALKGRNRATEVCMCIKQWEHVWLRMTEINPKDQWNLSPETGFILKVKTNPSEKRGGRQQMKGCLVMNYVKSQCVGWGWGAGHTPSVKKRRHKAPQNPLTGPNQSEVWTHAENPWETSPRRALGTVWKTVNWGTISGSRGFTKLQHVPTILCLFVLRRHS